MPLTLVEHISVNAKVFRGRPCIQGTRIPVDFIFDMRERDGMSPEEIAEQFPFITLSDVHAALSYYYDHRDEIQRMVAEADARMEELQRRHPNGSLTAGPAQE